MGEGSLSLSWPVAARAHVGRLLAYDVPKSQGTSSQLALIKEALTVRPLPNHLRGIAPLLKNFGNGIWAAARVRRADCEDYKRNCGNRWRSSAGAVDSV